MTEQEKIKILLQMGVGRTGLGNYEESKIIFKALEKQILKEPRFYNCNYYCPVCDDLVGCRDTIMKWDNKFCKHCGQAIKWE